MSLLNNTKLVVHICQLHYLENLSQKQIATRLDLSRPQISRVLAAARKENLVTIAINDPFAGESLVQNQIRRRYPVKEVFVFDTLAHVDKLLEFGRMAFQFLNLFVAEGNTVGVMSGRTVFAAVDSINSFPRRNLKVVPLVGGLGSLNADWHANAIALSLASKSGGASYVLNAPILVSEEKSKNMLVNEPNIASVLKAGAECDVAIVGIGDICQDSTTIQAGGVSTKDIRDLQEAGAVASVCCSYLNDKGEVLKLPLTNRSIGLSLPDLSNSKIVALAIGKRKLQAIHSALSSGYIHALMTDLETASGLVDLSENKSF